MPWTGQGPYSVGGAFSSANANNIELQFPEASQTLGTVDVVAPFVLFGGVCTKDGGNPKQLDVTQCVYYPTQPDGNNTLRRRVVPASVANQFLTATASTTYFLDFNPDGTTSWGTSHSGVANAINICSVTTDGSGNISAVTDLRGTVINLWPTSIGIPRFAGNPILLGKSNGGGVAGAVDWFGTVDPGGLAQEGDRWTKA